MGLILGVAIIAGIVGYAWYKKRNGGVAVPPATVPIPESNILVAGSGSQVVQPVQRPAQVGTAAPLSASVAERPVMSAALAPAAPVGTLNVPVQAANQAVTPTALPPATVLMPIADPVQILGPIPEKPISDGPVYAEAAPPPSPIAAPAPVSKPPAVYDPALPVIPVSKPGVYTKK